MRTNRWFFLVVGLLVLSSRAEATLVGQYSVEIEGIEKSGGRVGDFIAALSGWSCHAVSSVSYSEERINHRGAAKLIPIASDSSFNFSLLSTPKVSSRFQRDMSLSRNDVIARVGEVCQRLVSKSSTCTRYSNGKTETYPCTKTDYETASMYWSCAFPNLPVQVGQTTVQTCSETPVVFGTSFSGFAMLAMKFKDFQARMKLDQVEESFRSRLCADENSPVRYLIQLQGGVGGHVGEDDFHFRVAVNGKEVPEFRVRSGLLNEEIIYCSDREEDSLRISIGAVEKDLIFDDSYSSTEEPVRATPVGSRQSKAQIMTIHRKTYFSQWFTDKDHEIRVRVKRL